MTRVNVIQIQGLEENWLRLLVATMRIYGARHFYGYEKETIKLQYFSGISLDITSKLGSVFPHNKVSCFDKHFFFFFEMFLKQ